MIEADAIGTSGGVAVVSLVAHDVVVRAHVRRERWLALALAVMAVVVVALVVAR